jgi:hypothetical protein
MNCRNPKLRSFQASGLPCPDCKGRGREGQIAHTGQIMTCVGYFSPAGHDHDDNRVTYLFACTNPLCCWKDSYTLENRCNVPGCPWKSSSKASEKVHRYIPSAESGYRWNSTGKQLLGPEDSEVIPPAWVEPPPEPLVSFIQSNILMVRVEERLALSVSRPGAFVKLFSQDTPEDILKPELVYVCLEGCDCQCHDPGCRCHV